MISYVHKLRIMAQVQETVHGKTGFVTSPVRVRANRSSVSSSCYATIRSIRRSWRHTAHR